MELFRIEDVSEFAEFTNNIAPEKFNRVRKLVTANSVTPYISKPCLDAILAMDRESTTDQAKELYAFWLDFVRPYSVFAAYELFTDLHGLNFAPQGIVGMATGGPQGINPIESSERSSLRKMAVKYRDIYLAKMVEEYALSGATFDSVVYASTEGHKPKVSGIRAIGSVTAGMATKRRFRL
jgi:hypothetical protein